VIAGGVLVAPGDVIVADGDGALRIPLAEVPSLLARAEAKTSQEAQVIEALERGEELFDFLGFREVVKRLGIEQHSGTWQESAGPPDQGGNL
jgi:4-hydroxy-4-methyl-2-oxoglutarate aldolase